MRKGKTDVSIHGDFPVRNTILCITPGKRNQLYSIMCRNLWRTRWFKSARGMIFFITHVFLRRIKTESLWKLGFCCSGWAWGGNMPVRTMLYFWCCGGSRGRLARSPWVWKTSPGEVWRGKAPQKHSHCSFHIPLAQGTPWNAGLPSLLFLHDGKGGLQLVLGESMSLFPFSSKTKLLTHQDSVFWNYVPCNC